VDRVGADASVRTKRVEAPQLRHWLEDFLLLAHRRFNLLK